MNKFNQAMNAILFGDFTIDQLKQIADAVNRRLKLEEELQKNISNE